MCLQTVGGPQQEYRRLVGPGLWQGTGGAQEGRDVAHPDIPTYGFVIQVPQEQEVGNPPQPFPQGLDTRWGKDEKERRPPRSPLKSLCQGPRRMSGQQ